MPGSSHDSNSPKTLQFGDLTVQVAQLKMGALKSVRTELQAVFSMRKTPDELPTAEQLEAMGTLVFASAKAADPTLDRERFNAALDNMPYDEGIVALTLGMAAVMERSGIKKPEGLKLEGVATGEAERPAMAASTSSGSTD